MNNVVWIGGATARVDPSGAPAHLSPAREAVRSRNKIPQSGSAFPLAQDPDFYLFEFACHEGNYWSMCSMLGGARLADR